MDLYKYTISHIFIVPTLNISREDRENNGYINAFIKDSSKEMNYKDAVYLLFKPKNMDLFQKFIDNEKERTALLIDDYDCGDGYIVLVYKLLKKFKKDFELIKESKYSKTSIDFQNLFPKVLKIKKNGLHRDEISLQFRIFRKTKDLMDYWESFFGMEFDENQEVWVGFNEDKETLYIERMKETSSIE